MRFTIWDKSAIYITLGLSGALLVAGGVRAKRRYEALHPPFSTYARRISREEYAVLDVQMRLGHAAQKAEQKARRLYMGRRYREAESLAQSAIDFYTKMGDKSGNLRSGRLLGQIYMAQNRNREALPFLIVARRQIRSAELDIALAYCRIGDLKKSRWHYDHRKAQTYWPVSEESLPGTKTSKTLQASILMARAADAERFNPEIAVRDYAAAKQLLPTNAVIVKLHARCIKRWQREEKKR